MAEPTPESPQPTPSTSRVVDRTVFLTQQELAKRFSDHDVPFMYIQSPEQVADDGKALGHTDIRVDITADPDDLKLFDEGLTELNQRRNDLKGQLSEIEGMTPELIEEQLAKGVKETIIPFIAAKAAISHDARITSKRIVNTAEGKF